MVASHRRDEPGRRATFRIATAVIVASAGVGLAINLTDNDGGDALTSTWKPGVALPVLPSEPAPVVSLTEIPLSPVPTTPESVAAGGTPTSVGAATGQAAARVTRTWPAIVASAPAPVVTSTASSLPVPIPAPTTPDPTPEPTMPAPTTPPSSPEPEPSTTPSATPEPTASDPVTPDPSPSGDLPT